MPSIKLSEPKNPLIPTSNEEYSLDHCITKEELIQDIDFYKKKLEEVHPEPFRIISKDQFEKLVDNIIHQINQVNKNQFDIFESFFYFQEICALVQDGHTRIVNPYSVKNAYYIKSSKLFPLDIQVVDKKFFVRECWFETNIPKGSEILSINGKSIREIFDETIKFASATFEKYRYEFWSAELPSVLELYFGLKSPWTIEYKGKNGMKIIKLRGKEWTDVSKEKFQKKRYNFKTYNLTVNEQIVPVLVVPSFHYTLDSSFADEIDEFFLKIKDKEYLIIDLRRNLGGNGALGIYILRYLAKNDKSIESHISFDIKASKSYKQLVNYFIETFFVNENIPEEQRSFTYYKELTKGDKTADFRIKILEAETNDFVVKEIANFKQIKKENKFKGKVFLLISSETFSAGVVTAAAFKHNKLGVIVGRETGGRIGFFSDPIILELPNSNIRVSYPIAILNLFGGKLERGIAPDYEVRYTADDCIQQIDKDIELVKELISKDLE
ncbi:MAG TPA: S41 family peptidase [candidate division Zixibacteria bacterium]|nr:S41 family peptidase [candidate division Zixibacteria bacterium]